MRFYASIVVVCTLGLGLVPGKLGEAFGQPECRQCDQGIRVPPASFSLSTIAPPLSSPQLEQAIMAPQIMAAPRFAAPQPAPAHGHDGEFQEMPVPIIKVKVKAPANWETGKEMEYRIRIENVSSADAHHVVVRDTLPPSVRVLRASPLPHKRAPDLEWYWETLPGNGCADIVVAVMPMAVANAKNCVRVAYEHGQCVTTKVIGVPSDAPAGGGVRPPDIGPVIPPPPPFDPRGDLPPFGKKTGLAISVPKDVTVKVNEKQTFEYVIYNKGLIDAVNTGVFLEIPVDLDVDRLGLKGIPALTFPPFFNEIKDDISRKPYLRVGLQLGTLKPGEERRIYVPVLPLRVGAFDVLLKAKADTTDVEQANHQVKVALFGGPLGPPMTKRGGLHIQVADTDDPIMAGVGRTNYQIEVWNQGTDVVRDIQLVCRLSPQLRILPDKPYPAKAEGELTLITLDPIPVLAPDKKAAFTISLGAAEKPGQRRFEEARFEVQMQADILNDRLGPVTVQENTTIMKEDAFLTALRKRVRHER